MEKLSGYSVGFNTTLPFELIMAAGLRPVDLNNLFINADNCDALIGLAERRGFPRNCCAWIKGIYGAVLESGLKNLVMVENGDCSNACALGEILEDEGIRVMPFSYPGRRGAGSGVGPLGKVDGLVGPIDSLGSSGARMLEDEIQLLAKALNLDIQATEKASVLLDEMRTVLLELDAANGMGIVSGQKALAALLSGTDAGGGRPDIVISEARRIISSEAGISEDAVRLAYLGVPPINQDLLPYVEDKLGAHVVYLELPRQFAVPGVMPAGTGLAERYSRFTYAGPFRERFCDISAHIRDRKVEGVIHYVQAFCFRAMEDQLLRRWIDVPVITIEGDRPGLLDARTRMRLENFIFMLKTNRGNQ